jgi:sugar phosphate isomerase/epimerase/SAM-dependent methyltransferase
MMLSLGLSLFALLAAVPSPQDPARDPEQGPAGRDRFLGREVAHTMHWTGAPWLLRATREDEENGALLRRWLAVQRGQAVCDLGCGNGYHTLPLAEAVGGAGKVFAVDLQPEMLVLLRQRAVAKHYEHVELIEATVDDPKLAPNSCDLVLLVDVYHELSHPVRVMRHVRDALKPGGRVVLVEFRDEDPDVPIKPEHKMAKAQIVREMAEHGFALADEFDGLPWQHAMAFVAAAPGPRLAARELVHSFLRAAQQGEAPIVAPFLAPGLAPASLPPLRADLRVELRAGPSGGLLADLSTANGEAMSDPRDELVLAKDDDGRWSVAAVQRRREFRRAHGASWPFVAMQTATGGGEIGERAQLAREFGFDGLAWHLDHLAEVRRACEVRGGDLVSAYAVLDLGAGQGGVDRLAPLRDAMQQLTGGPGMVWLALQDSTRKPRDAAGDAVARATLAELMRSAEQTGIEIALYPHHGFWLETVDDALRLCEQVNHARLGVCFNLCHFLRANPGGDPAALLKRCGARLFAVTVNGADRDGVDWKTLIRPLDEGTFDLGGLFAMLDELHFAGPIGLQGFGITLPAREHLQRSMQAWQAFHGDRSTKKR